ncbi:MAG: SIMPL domain-containing protein [Planctomycetota bacterium]
MKHPMSLIALLMLVVGFALPLRAEQTITVNAFGEVKVKPDVLVLEGTISETNEKMKDAVTGFNDTRRRAMAAINEMGIENLAVKTSSLSMSIAGSPQGGPFGGIADVGEVAAPGAMQISQAVTLTVTGVDKMEQQAVIDLVVKLMEGVKEAGVEMSKMDAESMMMMQMGMGGGGGGSAIYKVSDPEAAHKAATKAAVEKARADAAYLAELAGGKLGKVVAISDGIAPVSEDNSGGNPYMAMIWGMMSGEDGSDPYATGTLDDVTVGRALSVSFELITE